MQDLVENSQIKFYYHSAQSPDEVFLPLGMESSKACAHQMLEEVFPTFSEQGFVETAFPHHTRMVKLLNTITEQ